MFSIFKDKMCTLCGDYPAEQTNIPVFHHYVWTDSYCIFCLKKIEKGYQPERSKREDLDCKCQFAQASLHDPRCGTLNTVEKQ